MKLVTTYAGLEMSARPYTWSTRVGLPGNDRRRAVLNGKPRHQGAAATPRLVLERHVAASCAGWQQAVRARRSRGDIVSTAAPRPGRDQPTRFRRRAPASYTVGATRLLLNYRSVLLTIAPDAARGPSPPWGLSRPRAACAPDAGPCRSSAARARLGSGALRASSPNRPGSPCAGASRRAAERGCWPWAYADPKELQRTRLIGMWQELAGAISGGYAKAPQRRRRRAASCARRRLAEIVRDQQVTKTSWAAASHAARSDATRRRQRGGVARGYQAMLRARNGPRPREGGSVIAKRLGPCRANRAFGALLRAG